MSDVIQEFILKLIFWLNDRKLINLIRMELKYLKTEEIIHCEEPNVLFLKADTKSDHLFMTVEIIWNHHFTMECFIQLIGCLLY